MTNEVKAKEIAKYQEGKSIDVVYRQVYFYTNLIDTAMKMAEWKDEQYKEEKEALQETINALDARLKKANESGMYYFDKCNIQKRQLIDKACKWLEEQTRLYYNGSEYHVSSKEKINVQEFIDKFKQAMEG